MNLFEVPALASTEPAVLMPGEWAVRSAPAVIETLLGSCVAVTLWDPLTCTGAACHFVLPGGGDAAMPDAEGGRYGRWVLPRMWRALQQLGIPPQRCSVKLFGGGRMFTTSGPDIGAMNVHFARDFIARMGATVSAESVGDAGHRRIRFMLHGGDVQVAFIRAAPPERPS